LIVCKILLIGMNLCLKFLNLNEFMFKLSKFKWIYV
jgi:hypothetical protein